MQKLALVGRIAGRIVQISPTPSGSPGRRYGGCHRRDYVPAVRSARWWKLTALAYPGRWRLRKCGKPGRWEGVRGFLEVLIKLAASGSLIVRQEQKDWEALMRDGRG